MNFGRVQSNELKKIDFKLPVDPAMNEGLLKGKKIKPLNAFVGCAKWGIKEWIGKLYPLGTKEANFLDEYLKHFNSIELNATHYKLYKSAEIKKWADKAKDLHFIFCPKVYKGISHFGHLTDKKILTDDFLNGIIAFQQNLGPIFLQVNDRFSPNRKKELFTYLETLPRDVQFFLEVRHPDWFVEPNTKELFTKLKKLKIGAVITDAAGRRDCCHMYLTIPQTFIRFVGNSLHPSDFKRIDAWVKRIKSWSENGLEKLYFFMHMHDEAYSPELSVYLIEKLNKACNLGLPKPKLLRKTKH